MSAQSLRILVAEDDLDIQTIVRISLEKVGGYTLEICDSGEALLEAYADFAPDLVILDVMMPDMGGPQTLQRLRQRDEGRDIPVLFMTAKSRLAEVEQLRALGAIGVIHKPFDPITLPKEIRRLWEGRHGS